MKLDLVCSTNDENYTPAYAITPLLKYLDKTKIKKIWCPFDTEDSLFVKIFLDHGYDVFYTHIKNGYDFFSFGKMAGADIPDCDIIISNPPYTLKTQVLKRLFEINKPFAMLVGVVGLFESEERFSMFRDNDFELLYFNRRISFFQSFEDQKPKLNPPFSSVYVTSKLLPNKINFESIDKHACKYSAKEVST